MTITFNTTVYGWANGHAPRGFGNWGFEFEGTEFWFAGKYSEAKRACIKQIKAVTNDAYVMVEVLP